MLRDRPLRWHLASLLTLCCRRLTSRSSPKDRPGASKQTLAASIGRQFLCLVKTHSCTVQHLIVCHDCKQVFRFTLCKRGVESLLFFYSNTFPTKTYKILEKNKNNNCHEMIQWNRKMTSYSTHQCSRCHSGHGEYKSYSVAVERSAKRKKRRRNHL